MCTGNTTYILYYITIFASQKAGKTIGTNFARSSRPLIDLNIVLMIFCHCGKKVGKIDGD